MSSTYTGSAGTLAPRTEPASITQPTDGDDLTAASANASSGKLADLVKMLQSACAFLGLANTFSQVQTFLSGMNVTGAVGVNGAISAISLATSAAATIGGTLGVTGAATLGPTTATATGSTAGLAGTSDSGAGLVGSSTNGPGIRANASGSRAPMSATVRTTDPVTLVEGDFWFDSSHRLNIVILGTIYRVTLS